MLSVLQTVKDVQKSLGGMGELDSEIGHKKEASRRVKGLQVRCCRAWCTAAAKAPGWTGLLDCTPGCRSAGAGRCVHCRALPPCVRVASADVTRPRQLPGQGRQAAARQAMRAAGGAVQGAAGESGGGRPAALPALQAGAAAPVDVPARAPGGRPAQCVCSALRVCFPQLHDWLARGPSRAPSAQSQLRLEAALSQIEEQHKDREAVEAANAASLAKLAENDAMARPRSCCARADSVHTAALSLPRAQVRSLANKLQAMEAKHEAGVGALRGKFEGLAAQAREHDARVAARLGFSIPALHGGQGG